MCVFLIRKMETLIFSLLEKTFLNRSFDEKQEIAKRGKCCKKILLMFAHSGTKAVTHKFSCS